MRQFFTQSINRLVMGSFVFVLLLPLGFILSNLSQLSWDSAEKEMQEKHLLLAKSLQKPVSLYFSNHQNSFEIFAETTNFTDLTPTEIKSLLHSFVNNQENLTVISFLSTGDGSSVIAVNDLYKVRETESLESLQYHATENKYRKYDTSNSISSVVKSTISNRPVVLLKHHVIGKDLNKRGTIFAEIDLQPIRDICNGVKFGDKGHCTIIDQLGQIVAHPDEQLVNEIKDISQLEIYNRMKILGSGLKDYTSPFTGEEAIAGFSTIDKLNWRTMVIQPKSEIQSPFKSVINTVITWLAVGIIVSLLVAYILTQLITKPLNSLVVKSKEIGTRSDTFNLGKIPENTPFEVSELWTALSALVSRLHSSNREIRKLNYSLSRDIEKATAKLRATNRHLYKISSNDHLTKIANRRYFEDTVNKILAKNSGEKVGIIVIDVDKFKFINDEYGHEAGDLALVHIAKMMKRSTRKNDIPARLGGDEFVIYIKNCSDEVLYKIAENLRKKVQSQPIVWEDHEIQLSLSVGTVNATADNNYKLDQLLKFADEAMYESKQAGRNHVSTYSFDEIQPNEPVTKPQEMPSSSTNQSDKAVLDNIEDEGMDLAEEIEMLLEELPDDPKKLPDEIVDEPDPEPAADDYWESVEKL